MELDFRHYPPRHRPTRRLIEKAFESKHRLLAWPSHWPRQQLPNVPLQIVVGGKADRVLHVAFFQRLVELDFLPYDRPIAVSKIGSTSVQNVLLHLKQLSVSGGPSFGSITPFADFYLALGDFEISRDLC
jgi:hypothetical protein